MKGFLELANGLLDLALTKERRAEVVVGSSVIWSHAETYSVLNYRFINSAFLGEMVRQHVLRDPGIRVPGDGGAPKRLHVGEHPTLLPGQ